MTKIKDIEDIINKASREIKEIVMQEAENIEFPEIMIGLNDPEYATEPEIVRGLFADTSVYSRGIALPKKGIIIHDEDKFWSENRYVIMLPDGLFTFMESMFMATKDNKPTNHIDTFPDWERKYEDPKSYLNFGKKVAKMMQEYKR